MYVASVEFGVMIYDVSDPTNPQQVGIFPRVDTAYPLNMVMSSDGRTMFIAAYNFFEIVDISDPRSPALINSVGTEDYAWGISLSNDNSKVYLASGAYMQVFDVSNTSSPVSISSFETLGTCLLYTSPSPRDATLSRMPSSA